MKAALLFALISFTVLLSGRGQVYFVDKKNGRDTNDGSASHPLKSLNKALELANQLTGQGSVTVKVMPGTYVLEDKLVVNPVRRFADTSRFTIEAYVNPDDKNWSPEKMPLITSMSENNSETLFSHSVGFLVASEKVTIRGIKFLGNVNQSVSYYYPIVKEDSTLADLEVTQCMFIGDKETSIIQGGIWAHGPKNVIDHCVFYECRNAVLLFDNVRGFRVTNSIISKAYESAFWWTPKDVEFEFQNNILIENENIIVSSRTKNPVYSSPIKNSTISNNKGFVGYWSREEGSVLPNQAPKIRLENVKREANIRLQENFGTSWNREHLHAKDKNGDLIKVGIFKN